MKIDSDVSVKRYFDFQRCLLGEDFRSTILVYLYWVTFVKLRVNLPSKNYPSKQKEEKNSTSNTAAALCSLLGSPNIIDNEHHPTELIHRVLDYSTDEFFLIRPRE